MNRPAPVFRGARMCALFTAFRCAPIAAHTFPSGTIFIRRLFTSPVCINAGNIATVCPLRRIFRGRVKIFGSFLRFA